VTRDSIILVDFIELTVRTGRPLFEAILEIRVVRLRPILLTAGAAMLSSIPITFDPIFSGLGWLLIFRLMASTVFTLFVIPVTYALLYQTGRTSGEVKADSCDARCRRSIVHRPKAVAHGCLLHRGRRSITRLSRSGGARYSARKVGHTARPDGSR
jgi:hypothetical protein